MSSIPISNNIPQKVTQSTLEQIVHALQEGEHTLYDAFINSTYTSILETLIQTKFPTLRKVAQEIIADVFEKFKADLLKKTISANQIADLLAKKTLAECSIAQPKEKELQQNLGMTETEFQQLIKELQQGNQLLFERIYLAHFKNCRSYLKVRCGAKMEEAHTSTMDALIEIRKDLLNDKIKYGNLAFYITRRARMKLYKLKKKKSNSMEMVSIEDFIPKGNNRAYKIFELRDLVKKTFAQLCEDCKRILEQKYGQGMTYPEILRLDFPNIEASILKKKSISLAKKSERCRDKFKHIIENL